MGRMFSNYARSLDPNNVAYTVAELTGNDTETPYPSAAINSPPGVRIFVKLNSPISGQTLNHVVPMGQGHVLAPDIPSQVFSN